MKRPNPPAPFPKREGGEDPRGLIDFSPPSLLGKGAEGLGSSSATLGVVVIGRNEGDRLRTCLSAVAGRNLPVVYVDSGSTDGSVATARGLGADVVALDLTTPFT